MSTDDRSARKIAITGAGGFIGSSLVQLFAKQGACVRALLGAPGDEFHAAPQKVITYRADILDSEVLLQLVSGCEVVVHAAGPPSVAASFQSPLEYARIHVLGTCAVAAACRQAGVRRLVYLSSAEVYGMPDAEVVAESCPVRPRSPYAAAKAGAEHFVTEFSFSGGNAVILRPFSIYGPRMSSQSVIATIVRQARRRQSIVLANLRSVRDYCHVMDLASAVMAACSAPLNGLDVFNVGTGQGTSVAGLAGLILDEMGLNLPVVESEEGKRPAGAEINRLVADPTRARFALGWVPVVSLREGIRTLIRDEAAR